jgi:hypothetical protein
VFGWIVREKTRKNAVLDRTGHGAALAIELPGTAPRRKTREHRDMTRPSAKEIKAIAEVAGVPLEAAVAERVANSIGPAFENFAPIAGTLPFDLEPASFLLAQTMKVSR